MPCFRSCADSSGSRRRGLRSRLARRRCRRRHAIPSCRTIGISRSTRGSYARATAARSSRRAEFQGRSQRQPSPRVLSPRRGAIGLYDLLPPGHVSSTQDTASGALMSVLRKGLPCATTYPNPNRSKSHASAAMNITVIIKMTAVGIISMAAIDTSSSMAECTRGYLALRSTRRGGGRPREATHTITRPATSMMYQRQSPGGKSGSITNEMETDARPPPAATAIHRIRASLIALT